VDEVGFEGEVLIVDAVLRGRVEVELLEAEGGAGEVCGAVYDDFDGGAKVFKFDGLLGNVEGGLFGGGGNGCILGGEC
jgi:hypothetical protein